MSALAALRRITLPVHSRLPGIVVAALLGLAALWMAGGLGEPLARNPVLVAMLFGLFVGNTLHCPDALRPGLDFTKRYLLRAAVVLVGFRITGGLLLDLGAVPLAVAAAELVLVLLLLRWIARRVFKLDAELALLVAVGSAVCGAAAILSVAAMTRAKEAHAGIAIALITLSGTLALLLYPVAFLAGWLPALDERLYGIFVGSSIYELAQVYGASFAVSEGALNTATLVKLSKVLMLLPLLLGLGLWRRRQDAAAQLPPTPWPWFIAGFVVVVAFNSTVTLHPQARRLILTLDQFLFVMVMVALGLTTRLATFAGPGRSSVGSVGWRLLGVACVGLVLSSSIAYGLVSALAALSSQTAAAPPSSTEGRMLAQAGGRLFAAVGCAKCHVPALAGRHGEVPLYSDLLLHDMGPALDDKIVQGEASGSDWRTTPLLGLGLRQRYLHDGRATTLRDAVLAHGGEAELVRDRYFELAPQEQQLVVEFLREL
jgi:uncharacterized integral membrane protein (TIGR00698 family)